MPHQRLLSHLETFLAQSRQLLILARDDNWEEFESLMAARQKNLPVLAENTFLIELAKNNLVEEAKELISAIKDIDNQILAVAERSKASISAQLRQSLQADKAIDAYKNR